MCQIWSKNNKLCDDRKENSAYFAAKNRRFAPNKWKITFYVKAPKTLDCKVACIGEVDKHANFQQKMLIFGGGLALRKPILFECHVKFYAVAIFVQERHGIVRQNAKITTYL